MENPASRKKYFLYDIFLFRNKVRRCGCFPSGGDTGQK
jgi:hypothetical protein